MTHLHLIHPRVQTTSGRHGLIDQPTQERSHHGAHFYSRAEVPAPRISHYLLHVVGQI